MTKRLAALALILLIGLTGCKQDSFRGSESEAPSTSNSESSSEPADPDGIPDIEAPEPEPEPEPETPALSIEGTPNAAAALISGADVLGDHTDALYLLIRYGSDFPWVEANQIDNLERGTPTATGEPYYLLIPKFVGSRVEVHQLVIAENANTPVPGTSYYLKESTPDNYGLVLTNSEPEGIPNLQVTVTYAGHSYSYMFTYDGRGDRPAIQVLTPEGPVAN